MSAPITNIRNLFCKVCFGIFTFPFFVIGFFSATAAWGLIAGWGFAIKEIEEML